MATDAQANNEDYSQEYGDDDNSQEYDDDQPQGDFDDQEENDDYNDQSQDQSGGGGTSTSGSPKYIRLRGLPWSATHQEILDFLGNVNVVNGSKGIHLITSRWDGKNTGEAYVEVQAQEDVEEARKLNKGSMGHRYIEVFTANPKEAKEAMRKTGSHGVSYVVKLRGLPYAVTEQQVEEFFNGLEIKPDREGILFVMDKRGRATGEAFVQFESQEDTEQALGRNREKIGHRYIEIFRSSLAELKRASKGNGRTGPYDLKDRGGNRGNDFGGGRNMRGGNGGGNGGGGFGNGGGGFGGFGNGGNFGNGNGNGGGGGGFGGNNRFNNSGGNFGNDFGDFGNFGNNRNFSNGGNFGNDFPSGNNRNGGSIGGGPNGGGNFGNFGNFFDSNGGGGGGSGGGNGNMGGGFNGGNAMGGGGNNGGNFGPIGGGRNDNEYFTIHMRGLPYQAFENEIYKFFDPIRPSNVRVNFNKKGLHSGTADVFFESYEDAQLAMKRHREQMGSRYIELFFDGKTKVGNIQSGGGGGGGNYSRRI